MMAVVRNQPYFFVFCQSFTCEENLDLSEFLKHLADNFESQQSKVWLEYWTYHGESILLEEWKLKYKDYLEETVQPVQIDENYTNESNIVTYTESVADDSVASSKAWQDLWIDHTQNQYGHHFEKFCVVFNAYYWDLDTAINQSDEQESIGSCSSLKDVEEEEKEEEEKGNEISNELEQLKLLGLPTSFGCKNSCKFGKQKKRTSAYTKIDEILEYKDFFDSASPNMPAHEDSSDADADDVLHHILEKQKIAKKKKNKNRLLRSMPNFMQEDKSLWKYWFRRFSLFSRFDEGIRLDRESWFSVTPEKIAGHLATRLACDIIVDGFCGCGGNAIQFAKTCKKVIAIDIDPEKIAMAKHNANVYGVAERIEFIVGDFLHLSRSGKLLADLVFLSPPWGGPTYKKLKDFDIEKFLLPLGATELMECSRLISPNIALFLPRNANLQQIIRLAGNGNRCELEHNYLNTRLVALTALYGEDIVLKKSTINE